MGAVAVEDGFEQSSSGDYSGKTLGRSSKISEKNLYFQYLSVRLIPPLKSPPMSARISGFFCLQQGPQPPRNTRTDALSY
jgi:hypothetical protein